MAGLQVVAVPVVVGPQEGIREAEETLVEAEEVVLAAVEPREVGDGTS